jgi:hypothetical protein
MEEVCYGKKIRTRQRRRSDKLIFGGGVGPQVGVDIDGEFP